MNISNCPWDSWIHQEYLFCETELCSWVVQPANTWSNIGYLVVALLILRSGKERLFGVSVLALFFGSTFFHLSGTHVGKLIDVGSMFLISMGLLSHAVQRTWNLDDRKAFGIFLAGIIASVAYLLTTGSGHLPFVAELVFVLVLEIRLHRSGKESLNLTLVSLACGVEVLAFIAWLLDVKKIFCSPDNHFISGHAVWHLLSAQALYLVFMAKKKGRLSDPDF